MMYSLPLQEKNLLEGLNKMTSLSALVKRNCKLFFKDKGLFFTSLITPLILLVLYATFLANVYTDTFNSIFNEAGITIDEKLVKGMVGGELVSSILAVSCVTVAFCSNMLMVQDKFSGAKKDLTMTPVKSSTLALGYYIATVISTLIVCFVAMGICLIYLSVTGWYLSFGDVMLIILDVIMLVLFGTALSSIINMFLSTQGQLSAVGTIVSSGYGFICGAYMPLSQFGETLRAILSFLPGTYGTSIIRNHCLNGTFQKLEEMNMPSQFIEELKDGIDCNLYFFNNKVDITVMCVIIIVSVAFLIGLYILLNYLKKKDK